MKQTKQLSILLVLALIVGCAGANHGAVKVAIKPETTFAKNASITVVPDGGDELGAQGKLERLLVERGFQVIPQPAAEITVDKLKSDYLFQFQYETDPDADQEPSTGTRNLRAMPLARKVLWRAAETVQSLHVR